jgi:hypothetical protein
MRRVERQGLFMLVIALVITALYLLPQAHADNLKRPVRIGVLTESWGPPPGTIGLQDGLEVLGYREDRDYVLGIRFTQGNLAELPAAARELIKLGVDLIVADRSGDQCCATRHDTNPNRIHHCFRPSRSRND